MLVACGGEPDAPITESAGPVFEVGVTGMTWSRCDVSVRETLGGLDGVDRVSVNRRAGQATVAMKDGASLEKSAVETALSGKGFGVSSFAKRE
jgi:copper chaperone CopZ